MRSLILFVSLMCAAIRVFAQAIEPGEWEFNAVTTSPLFPKGQSTVFKRCIKKEDADNPEAWMARQNEKSDCKLTPGERTAASMRWTMFCDKTNMRGAGIARLTGPGAVESEMQMSTEFQGYRVEMNTRTTGRRVGACSG